MMSTGDPGPVWSWFQSNEEKLYQLLGSDLTDVLYDEFIKYDSRLGVEVCTDQVVRDVIVTAQDQPAAFDSVKQLIRAAPPLDRWTFKALRPAKGFTFKTEADGIKLDASTLMFESVESKSNPTALGLRIYVPGALEVNEWLSRMVTRAISTGIGEELFSIVKHLEVRPGLGAEGNHSIKDLSRYVEWHIRRNS